MRGSDVPIHQGGVVKKQRPADEGIRAPSTAFMNWAWLHTAAEFVLHRSTQPSDDTDKAKGELWD